MFVFLSIVNLHLASLFIGMQEKSIENMLCTSSMVICSNVYYKEKNYKGLKFQLFTLIEIKLITNR